MASTGHGPGRMGPPAVLTDRLDIDPSAWIAPGAVLAGEVRVAARASVWFGCVVRGDLAPVSIGARTSVQDLTVIHVDEDLPAILGSDVVVGHRVVVHGCTVGDGAMIGMGAVLLSGCRIGPGAVVAAGAVVREGFEVPAGSVVAGVPGRLHGRVSERLRRRISDGVEHYLAFTRAYRGGRLGADTAGGTGNGP